MGDIPPTFDEDQVTECNCESIVFGEGPEDLKVLFPRLLEPFFLGKPHVPPNQKVEFSFHCGSSMYR